jgi:hypothetical protein
MGSSWCSRLERKFPSIASQSSCLNSVVLLPVVRLNVAVKLDGVWYPTLSAMLVIGNSGSA